MAPAEDSGYGANEPTMGEKLESLRLIEEFKAKETQSQNEAHQGIKPPSADSVHVMLKQALNAEDRQLLLNCMYTKSDKVIDNSIARLTPVEVLKLLNSLISLTQTRGAVLACAIPWIRSLLIQHASSIISQESSVPILNSLYQLIESRTSTYGAVLNLSTSLAFLFPGIVCDEIEEESIPPPVIFEDKDSDEESNEEMETDKDEELAAEGEGSLQYDSDGSDVMSQ